MSVLFCFQIAQKPLLSQVTAPPFTITLEEVTYSDWPGIHSFALGEWDGRWLIMTGRTGGLHGFLPPTPFPIIDANKQIHLFDRRIGDLPVHLQFFGNGGEAFAELGEHEGQRVGPDLDAHEIAPALVGVHRRFGVEGGFEDPALVFGDEARNLGDDAGAVRAGGGEGEEAFAVHDVCPASPPARDSGAGPRPALRGDQMRAEAERISRARSAYSRTTGNCGNSAMTLSGARNRMPAWASLSIAVSL